LSSNMDSDDPPHQDVVTSPTTPTLAAASAATTAMSPITVSSPPMVTTMTEIRPTSTDTESSESSEQPLKEEDDTKITMSTSTTAHVATSTLTTVHLTLRTLSSRLTFRLGHRRAEECQAIRATFGQDGSNVGIVVAGDQVVFAHEILCDDPLVSLHSIGQYRFPISLPSSLVTLPTGARVPHYSSPDTSEQVIVVDDLMATYATSPMTTGPSIRPAKRSRLVSPSSSSRFDTSLPVCHVWNPPDVPQPLLVHVVPADQSCFVVRSLHTGHPVATSVGLDSTHAIVGLSSWCPSPDQTSGALVAALVDDGTVMYYRFFRRE